MNNDPSARRIQVFPDPAGVARAGAEEFTRLAGLAVREHGRFTVALAGGSTPKAMYALLAAEPAFRERVPWGQTHLFFSDERHVPPDDKDSNFRMAREAMLDPLQTANLLPTENIHRIPAENPDAYTAATGYEASLRAFFDADADLDAPPRFDLILLGMGPDGHTASLFPGTTGLRETERLVAAAWVDKLSTYRLTFTPPLLAAAAAVMFLVSSADKAEVLAKVLEGHPAEPDRYPSQGITARDGETLWLLDRAAADKLKSRVGE